MDKETVAHLKKLCGEFLHRSGADIKRKSGKSLAVALWIGAVSGRKDSTPYVEVCLLSGRIEELVEMPA